MIKAKDLRIGNVIWSVTRQKIKFVNHRVISDIASNASPLPYSGVQITKIILRDNLGFEVTDLADYWEFLKGDFVITQPKLEIMPGIEMPFVFAFKSIVPKTILFEHVHHLQNFHYYTQQKELEWKQ